MLADQYNTLQSAYAAAEKIFTVLDIVPEVVDDEDAIEVDLIGNIEFKNVWFAYVENEWILKDVSFKINANECAAFVGATGAGKTTILSLITRNYDIQEGEILIDGINIRKIKISSLRKQIGQMLQDVFLFSGTLASNIRLDEESITDEEIMDACKEVNAISFINKIDGGINALVGERGNNLSLGQRQLISFARTLVHKPKIMILDEATANIDTETEKIIQESLEKVIKNNTMLMVAHRLSTIQHADVIFVFDHGRIIEQGSHQELLKQKGRYYQLFMLQYQKNELKNISFKNN
jgi:ATP-binding cassette subfamily B protein